MPSLVDLKLDKTEWTRDILFFYSLYPWKRTFNDEKRCRSLLLDFKAADVVNGNPPPREHTYTLFLLFQALFANGPPSISCDTPLR
jgi:hypothetical protein